MTQISQHFTNLISKLRSKIKHIRKETLGLLYPQGKRNIEDKNQVCYYTKRAKQFYAVNFSYHKQYDPSVTYKAEERIHQGNFRTICHIGKKGNIWKNLKDITLKI